MAIDYKQVSSPCYVLDESRLRRNLELIKSVQDQAGIEIIMAFKACAMWGAFPIINEYIPRAAASSIHEARLAYEEMGTKAHTYSPAFTIREFAEILTYSSHITFNSLSQFELHKETIKQHSEPVSIGLRINPEFSDVETDLYNPCAAGTRLGVAASNLPKELPAEIEGLHFHSLCESSSFDLEKTLQTIENKFAPYLKKAKWINMGGGHLMTRKEYDTKHLIKILKSFKERWGLKIILEPGSAFMWQTGNLVASIVDIVEDHGIKTAILDVSFTAHMPDCLEMPYKPRITGAYHEPQKDKPTYRMGGNSCLAGDYMGLWSFDKRLKAGDKVIFEDMIHYTMVKTNMFNGVPHPAIAIWNDQKGLNIIRQFGYEDYKRRMG